MNYENVPENEVIYICGISNPLTVIMLLQEGKLHFM